MYGFSFEEKTEKAMKDYSGLLAKINKDKIRQEVSKIKGVDKDFEEKLFKEFSIHQYIDVIE